MLARRSEEEMDVNIFVHMNHPLTRVDDSQFWLPGAFGQPKVYLWRDTKLHVRLGSFARV